MKLTLLLCSVFASLALAGVADAHRGPFKCIHDSKKIQQLQHSGMDLIMPQPGGKGGFMNKEQEAKNRARLARGGARAMEVQAVGGLRAVVSSLDLDDSTKYCSSVGQSVPDFTGGTVTCQSYDVLTADKKKWLLEKILPAALTSIAYQLQVDQLTSNLMVPSGACSHFTIPTSHTTTGVSSADFVLYVAVGPSAEGNLAWAATCSRDANRRPIVGRANFNPRYINWTSTNSINEEQVATAVHELLHALGFSSGNFVSTTKDSSYRGKEITYVDSTEVKKIAREYYGCSTALGAEVEDEGGTGSAGSHWDRRVLKDEMMAAAGGDLLSVFTLAHMKDTGWYTVDYSTAANMEWSASAGCDFLQNKCNTAKGGKEKYFCFDNAADMCTYKKEAIGYCPIFTYGSALPSHFQYFTDPNKGGEEFYDYCPVPKGYSNRLCTDGSIKSTTTMQQFGHYFGVGGKCFDTTGLLQDGLSAGSNAPTLRCLRSRCISEGAQVQFQVDSSGWIDCPTDGSTGTVSAPSGWQGSIKCPAAVDICSSSNTFTNGPPTPAPPVPPATAIPPNVQTVKNVEGDTTIKGSLELTGAKATWQSLIDGGNKETSLTNALQSDIGRRLSVDPVHVVVSNLAAGSLKFDYKLIAVSSVTHKDVQNIWTDEEGSGFWLIDTGGVYRSTGDNSTFVLTTGSSEKVENGNSEAWCLSGYSTEECNYIFYVAGGCLIAIVLVLIIVCCCCCREPSPEEKAEAGRQNRQHHYENRQQQQYGATSNQGGRQGGRSGGRRGREPY